MFDVKIASAAAGAAFILSLLVGLFSGVGFGMALLRALFLGAAFFGLAAGAQFAVGRFLPELSGKGEGEDPDDALGSRVDLSVGDDGSAPLGAIYGSPSVGQDGGGAAGETGSGLDQGGEGGYTGVADGYAAEASSTGSTASVEAPQGAASFEPARPPDLVGDVDVLPDLESMSDSFVAPLGEASFAEAGPSRAGGGGSSGGGASGDFDAREMAAAIQTILKREQKG